MKRTQGIYYTTGNPFNNPAFKDWAECAKLSKSVILEPFAGANSLIQMLGDMRLCNQFASYDLKPAEKDVRQLDTLSHFPQGYSVCVTNPPWLAKNSATARKLPFPQTQYDDLYKFALDKCLRNCEWVAALIPESFIRANLFRNRLKHFVSLTRKMFNDTGHPVGLALFQPEMSGDIMVWRDDKMIGLLSMLEQAYPKVPENPILLSFNEPEGNVGLLALDNTYEASIRFCDVNELKGYAVKPTGRHITKIKVNAEIRIKDWNDCLMSFRAITQDVLMTCYKGIRKDGQYRRRLDWNTARGIVNYVR